MFSQRLIAIITLIIVSITIMGCDALSGGPIISFGFIFLLILFARSLDRRQDKKKEKRAEDQKFQEMIQSCNLKNPCSLMDSLSRSCALRNQCTLKKLKRHKKRIKCKEALDNGNNKLDIYGDLPWDTDTPIEALSDLEYRVIYGRSKSKWTAEIVEFTHECALRGFSSVKTQMEIYAKFEIIVTVGGVQRTLQQRMNTEFVISDGLREKVINRVRY